MPRIKITCLSHNVTFKALNENGKQVLKEIYPKLTALGKVSAVNFKEEYYIQFSPLDNQLDEDSKLQSATIFDGLRVISTFYQHSQTPDTRRWIICSRSRRKQINPIK